MNNVKFGDIFQLGNHRIMCGDSSNEEMVRELVGDRTIKTIFTSPPYNMNKQLYLNFKDNKSSEEFIEFNVDVVKKWEKYLEGFLFWNTSYNKNSRGDHVIIKARILQETGFNFLEDISWDKVTPIPIRSNRFLTRRVENIMLCTNLKGDFEFNMKEGMVTNYWRFLSRNIQGKNNSACFPIELPIKGIELTTDEGDVVADPFLGSGTTLLACEGMNRICLGMDIEPASIKDTIDAWEYISGEKAIKIGSYTALDSICS